MAKYNKNLDNQFKSLGFHNYQDMLLSAQSLDRFLLFSFRETVPVPNSLDTDNIEFRFLVHTDIEWEIERIVTISTAIERYYEFQCELRKGMFDSNIFEFGNDPLPAKAEIIKVTLNKCALLKGQRQETRKLFRKNDSLIEEKAKSH